MARAIVKTADQDIRFVAHDPTERFPFDEDDFDRVLCCLVLEHISDLDAAIGLIASEKSKKILTDAQELITLIQDGEFPPRELENRWEVLKNLDWG